MLNSNDFFKCHGWCCHETTDWRDFTAHVFNFFDLYATDVKIYPGNRSLLFLSVIYRVIYRKLPYCFDMKVNWSHFEVISFK